MSEENDGFNRVVDGELFKWDKPGSGLMGRLQAYNEKKDTGKGVGHVYEVKTKDGVAAFFAPSLLQKKLANIPVGSIVKITYVNETKTAVGNTLKNFEVGFIKQGEPAYDAKLKELGIEDFNTVGDDKPAVEGQGMKLDDGQPM